MKSFLIILTLTTSLCFAQIEVPEVFSERLTSNWFMKGSGESTITEGWRKLADGYFEGISAYSQSPVSSYLDIEKLALFKFHHTWYYMAHPSQNSFPVLFELTEINDTSALFVNSNHDYPQKIRYTFIGTDSLSAEISLINNENLRKFGFKKISGKDD